MKKKKESDLMRVGSGFKLRTAKYAKALNCSQVELTRIMEKNLDYFILELDPVKDLRFFKRLR